MNEARGEDCLLTREYTWPIIISLFRPITVRSAGSKGTVPTPIDQDAKQMWTQPQHVVQNSVLTAIQIGVSVLCIV